jgi:hypothetical protein
MRMPAIDTYASRQSGASNMVKPNLHIVPLVGTPITPVFVSLPNGEQVYVWDLYKKLHQAGSCVMLDQNITLGDYAASIIINFDEVTYNTVGMLNGFTLQPENVLDVRPGQFNTIAVQAITLANSYPSSIIFGRLVVGDGFYVNQTGSGASTPSYTLPGKQTVQVLSQWNGTVGGGWSNNSGLPNNATGIFTYQNLFGSLLGLGYPGYTVEVTNIGSSIVYLSTNVGLFDSTVQANINQTYPLPAGERATFTNVGGTGFGSLCAYSSDANAGIAYIAEILGK